MRWIWWFCLHLAFKVCPQTLAQRSSLDSPTQVEARTRHTHFLPPFHSPSITSVCGFTYKHAVKWLFQHSRGGKKKKTFHVEFIKQFECDYVNELCLIQGTVWTSGVHTDCDKLHSFTAVHVCGGGFWLLDHVIVWECLHLNSSHMPRNITVFLKLQEMRGKMCRWYFPANLGSCCCDLEN